MPEKTWIEHATFVLDLLDSRVLSVEERLGMAKVMMLIALVEELRKTNAILVKMERKR